MIIEQPKVLVPKYEVEQNKLSRIEKYGRVCYKSEDLITNDSSARFIDSIIQRGHESVIEHEKITVIFIVDRGVSHEIVRHRIASYSQESTRYCNYSKSKFGKEITVIEPFFFKEKELYQPWEQACREAEKQYMALMKLGAKPEQARSVLPNSLKTEIVVTYNFREWRHFFKLRCSKNAHPQMRQVSIPLYLFMKDHFNSVFADIEIDRGFPKEYYANVEIFE